MDSNTIILAVLKVLKSVNLIAEGVDYDDPTVYDNAMCILHMYAQIELKQTITVAQFCDADGDFDGSIHNVKCLNNLYDLAFFEQN